jgi:hypothetical protein
MNELLHFKYERLLREVGLTTNKNISDSFAIDAAPANVSLAVCEQKERASCLDWSPRYLPVLSPWS